MKQIILTGVSGSWKTSIAEQLFKQYPSSCGKPIQFTTRKPRSDEELDQYVFLTKEQFYTKLDNWDFMEWTEYNWNLYAVSRYFDHSVSNVYIVEPAWKAQLVKHFLQEGIAFASYYISIPEEVAIERMMNRGDSVKTIEARKRDFLYFDAMPQDVVLDWELTLQHNVNRIALLCNL